MIEKHYMRLGKLYWELFIGNKGSNPTKNGNLTPNDILRHSGRRVWWKCDKGDDHEWLCWRYYLFKCQRIKFN